MKISCNKLKTYIKNSDIIDWIKVWDKFAIRTAEVEGIEIKGKDLKDVVVAEIVECEKHPTKEKYHVLKVNNGKEVVDILCGAPNVRKGLKVAIVKPGGMVCGIIIEPKKIAGVVSQGMLCSQRELAIGDEHNGIMELPDTWIIGTDIKEYLPIEDIIVEIDNKSLTNRPDLWGHYGIAREIAAITNNELIPLELVDISNNKNNLDITISDSNNCFRYMGLKMGNIINNKTPLDMQIFLYYAGMRSISLLVDLTNYVMLELGQPMHAFDARVVNKIEVGKAKDGDNFVTLDNVERKLTKDMLMIKNDDKYFGIAGVMGGLSSEILDDTDSIVLESATFNAVSIRKTATSLGLRTEASSRYEKSLDPNMAEIAIKRYVKLLQEQNPDLEIISNLTDIYPSKLEEKEIVLKKEKVKIYMGQEINDNVVKNILTSLGFKVKILSDSYKVTVPTFRATKDIEIAEDLIEEIARMYGYENFKLEPLKLDLTFVEHENLHDKEYEVKRYLATKYDLSEVHTYLWYKTSELNKLNIRKDGLMLLGKQEDNVLRNDLGLSLIEVTKENMKYTNKVSIFEIGTIFIEGESKRSLSICLADSIDNTRLIYDNLKNIVNSLLRVFKKKNVEFIKTTTYDYYNSDYTYEIRVDGADLGIITLANSKVAKIAAKKGAIAIANIDFDKYIELEKEEMLYQEISKYPTITLDYTVIANREMYYRELEDILKGFTDNNIKYWELYDLYEDEKIKKYTIRYIVGSMDRTLSHDDIVVFQNSFINYIKEKGLSIVE